MPPLCSVAGVFTKNQIVAAPVTLCRKRLGGGVARALLVNAGNANACTGEEGMRNALLLSKTVSNCLDVSESQVFISSTGVIGEQLPIDAMIGALPTLKKRLAPAGWEEAARAIMTTDTFPKTGARSFLLDGCPVTCVGIAKGAGMIHPNMATMLAYLFTDAAVTAHALQALLERATTVTFNSITVDGETSTNDTVMAFSSGVVGNRPIEDPDDPRSKPLKEALLSLCRDLACQIVRDGEGATKFMTIVVTGARHEKEAKQVAMGVAKSPLVKTAFFGRDPNWGRILSAVGNAGAPLDEQRLSIALNGLVIVKDGVRAGDYTEVQGDAVMQHRDIELSIDLGLGRSSWRVWTCDLSHGYISINADYRS